MIYLVNQSGKPNLLMKNFTLLQNLSTLTLVFLISFNLTSQTYTSDPDDLADYVNAAGTTGGTFIVKNGTYNDFEATFQVIATADNPIIIKAETVGGVTLKGAGLRALREARQGDE